MSLMQRLLHYRYRISAQLYLALGVAVALTFAACMVGWFSFDRVGAAQNRVNERSVPELAAAFGMAQHSGELVAAADTLTGSVTSEEIARVGDHIATTHQLFKGHLATLENKGGDPERFERIHTYSTALINNIASINSSMWQRFALTEQSDELLTELETLTAELDGVIVPEIDRQFFYIQTGYLELGQPKAPPNAHLSEIEQAKYRYLSELQSNTKIAVQQLASASVVSDVSLIEPFRERFESSASNIRDNLNHLRGTPQYAELLPVFNRLLELGTATENGFELRSQQLALDDSQQLLLSNNRAIAALLLDEVDSLVVEAEMGAQTATEASSQAIFTGRMLLLIISFVSVGGALLIAWLFVGRVLLRRLELLSGWMRRMAGGDLDAQVEIGGRDEVADMAAALEIFRQHAQEAIRLNLVEELAQELEGKNAELEGINARLDSQNHELEGMNARLDSQNHELDSKNAELENINAQLDNQNHQLEEAMTNLTAAQDRIVAQEKLASLGQLTAGVAHEIRNPLNFVKNFSESSEELLDEMRETMEESEDGQLDDEQRELIQDIFSDLSENLERIRMHGDRANRIVQDMLLMGRESVSHQMSNINNLLDEHARLAYHSARAVDDDFQLDLQYDFEEMPDIEVNPRDIGRVFLNMVNNACYATDEKRRQLMESSGENGYMPTLLLSTRTKGERVEVRIRDNGNGMPADIVDQIFNPFFTTKPTGQGTGLGLSICSDIIREHGGTIEVTSESGEFTEMVIGLPVESPRIPELDLDSEEAEDEEEYASAPV